MKACCDLVEQLGGIVVGAAVLIELKGLGGHEKVGKKVNAVIQY
jgi:adenine/guanine phosphoribosyltransferase-like PRPP-binding protein